MKYRNNNQIMNNVLEITADMGLEGIQSTPLMTKSNLPHSRFTKIIEKLTGIGLINRIEVKNKNIYIITDKGRLYLEEYKKFSSIAESFGLEL